MLILLPFQHHYFTISAACAADQPADAKAFHPQLVREKNDPDIIHQNILELVKEKRYEEALKRFTPEILDPIKFPKIYSDYLVILVWSGNEQRAITLYEALPESFIKRPYLLRNLAQAYYHNKAYLTAATLYQTTLNLAPSDEEAQKGLIKSLIMAKDMESALKYVNRFLLRSPNSYSLLRLKADIYATQGRYLEAIKFLGDLFKPIDNDSMTYPSKGDSSLSPAFKYQKEMLDNVHYSLNKGDFAAGMKFMLLMILTKDHETAIQAVRENRPTLQHDTLFTLNEVAEAYFKSDQKQKFHFFFSAILDLHPNHIEANIGLAYYYLQTNNDQKALRILDKLKEQQPINVEIRFARAFALTKSQQYWDAIQEYNQILTFLPENPFIRELRLLAFSKMGASSYALERAKREFPERKDLHDALIDDMAVDRIYWNESADAIQLLEPLADTQRNLEVHFDYIVSLVENKYHREAIRQYEKLLNERIAPPWWLDEWIAGAYLELKKPQKALVIYNQVLAIQPRSFKSRIGKFYALQELRRWEEARSLLREIDNDIEEVNILPSFVEKERTFAPNWKKLEVVLAKGWFELYQDRLKEGQAIFDELYEKAPSDNGIRNALAHAHLWRGWPRKALKEFSIIDSMIPETEYKHQIGKIGALNQLGDKEEARKEVASLLSLYPRDRHIQDLSRELAVEDMYVFSSDMLFEKEDGGTRTLQAQFNISKKIHPRTRIYGLTLWQEMKDDDQAGEYRRGGLGIDHTFDDTFSIKQQFLASYEGDSELGSFTHIAVNPNDYLFMDATYDSFSTDMPLQARLAGIDAKKISAGMTYRESDWREYHIALSRQKFSDTNNRDHILLGYEQGLYAKNDWLMRLYVDTSHSRNSLETAPYFNPKRDWTVSATHMTQHTIWRLYGRSFVHRLYITAGNYKQSGYSNAFTGSVYYEQEYDFSDTHTLKAGLSTARNVYDGESENSFSIHLSYLWRF